MNVCWRCYIGRGFKFQNGIEMLLVWLHCEVGGEYFTLKKGVFLEKKHGKGSTCPGNPGSVLYILFLSWKSWKMNGPRNTFVVENGLF